MCPLRRILSEFRLNFEDNDERAERAIRSLSKDGEEEAEDREEEAEDQAARTPW